VYEPPHTGNTTQVVGVTRFTKITNPNTCVRSLLLGLPACLIYGKSGARNQASTIPSKCVSSGFLSQAHASAAVVNFSENCTPEIMKPYMDALIGKLIVLLQSGNKLVMEGALTALASVADCAQVGCDCMTACL